VANLGIIADVEPEQVHSDIRNNVPFGHRGADVSKIYGEFGQPGARSAGAAGGRKKGNLSDFVSDWMAAGQGK
jgi:hypothetical protein